MKTINQLVVQSDMPNNNNVIWACGNTAKYYNNGTWTTLGESNEYNKELEEKVDSLDKEIEKEIQNINSRYNTLNTKHESLSRTVQGIAATGGASTATNVTYNNDSSGLNAENAQDAIDELVAKNATKVEKAEVTAELEKKFDKESILQESGEAEDKVMSQKATTTAISDETTRAKAAEKINAETITNEVARLDEKIDDKTNEINVAKEEALQAIAENEQSVISNFNTQRVTPEMLSESTKQLIEASGGGTITNLADDEDLTSVDDGTGSNVLKFADRTYNANNFSGKGYKILRKNIQSVNIASTKINITEVPSVDGTLSFTINGKETRVAISATTDNTIALVSQKVATALQASMTEYDVSIDASLITLTRKSSGSVTPSVFSASTTGVVCTVTDSTKREFRNILTPDMINQPNTIYEIRYDFDLDGGTVNIPDNCTLKFEGGSLKNGTILANNTSIKGCANCLSKVDAITGTVFEGINLSWIGVYKNNQDNSKNIKKLKNISSNVFIVDTDITLYEPDVILPKNVKLLGFGHNITYNCESCNKGLLILSESCYLENLKIESSSQKYNGVIVLADTEINKVHTFKLNNVEITGQYNSSKNYKSTALKINASNFEDNSDNYITGCQLHGIRISWVNIGIEFTCINNNYSSSKSFAWLNEVYINTLYISALSYGIKTYFEDNATNNRTDSVGPLYCSQFEFQALSNKAVMFKHSGNWTLNINTGHCWDSDYKGIITSGIVDASSIYGVYKTDGTYTDDSGVSYKLIDSVKVYSGNYNILSGINKTPDIYREECYNSVTDVNKWIVGCENSDFVFNRVKSNSKRYFSSLDGFYFSDHIKTAGPNISKSLYNATGGGCVELTYAKRYAQDNDFVILNTNCHFVGRNFEIVSTRSNSELVRLYISQPIEKEKIYKGKLKVLFKDNTYKEYKKSINFLNIEAFQPLQNISNMKILNSRYIEEEDNLFIEFEAECISSANGFSPTIEFFYNRRINKNSKWVFNFDNLPNIKIPLEAFVYGVKFNNFTYYKKIGNTESRPSNIQNGFQFFDTTLNKPIWWIGTKWVDATGADV